jgi:hypothetical protein
MEKFEYIGNKRLTIGGKAISPDGLSRLSKKALDLACKNKVIRKLKHKKDEQE